MASRQLPAASCASRLLNSTCINFSASRKLAAETSGPTGDEVANAEGAPGGAPGGAPLCAGAALYAPMEAPTTPRDALVRKRLREFINYLQNFLRRNTFGSVLCPPLGEPLHHKKTVRD